MRHAYERMWHAQLAWYQSALSVRSDDVWQCYLLCVEATAPHCVTVLRVPRGLLADGERSITLWAERFRACEDSGEWPGYTEAIIDMTRPAWLDEVDGETD